MRFKRLLSFIRFRSKPTVLETTPPSPKSNIHAQKKIVTYERLDGRTVIPGDFGIPHGTTGWCDGKLLIYNNRYKEAGWYTLLDYRIVKSLSTGKPDHRIQKKDLRYIPPFIKFGTLILPDDEDIDFRRVFTRHVRGW